MGPVNNQKRLFLPDAISIYVQFVIIGSILYGVYYVWKTLNSERRLSGFAIATLAEEGLGPKESYLKDSNKTIAAGLKSNSGPFQIITGTGPKLVLQNRFADELRNRSELDFNEAFRKDFFAHYPGFDGFRASLDNPTLIPSTLRIKMTQSLGLVTNHLVDEATAALHELYGENREWHSIAVKQHNLNFIARLSSRVFLGRPICRNEKWIEIAKNHTGRSSIITFSIDSFLAARDLRAQPFFLRRIKHYFMPHNKNIRKYCPLSLSPPLLLTRTPERHYADAKQIINTEVERRKIRAQIILASGGKPAKVSDAIGWMVEMSGGKEVDYVAAQLSLTVASIHATTEALTSALLDLVTYPEIIPPLRQEIIEALSTGGWSKQALFKMKLMDSFLKESQRLHPVRSSVWLQRSYAKLLMMSFDSLVMVRMIYHGPISLMYDANTGSVSMNRKVMRRVTLSDGTVLPVGARLMVAGRFRDPEIYENPDKFDAYRFFKLREENPNGAYQYVSTSGDMFGFGHGNHACPGRFLASSELKIALAHMILKYDWKLDQEDTMPKFFQNETAHMTNPEMKLMMRRRTEEIDLDLKVDPDLIEVKE
ncbi:hypothetical protein HYFRA_00008109 [Hymenoscyphus fraxineus]|uniref:Cytochrome P450 n=1 Tax=Hymenoscyphus fraxineus TaxID=746836 RepID=A0A9N9LA94_9HELO|nr:hypothetical protein HYFRA_00008109 [Hymenoscyphus fraxineus]